MPNWNRINKRAKDDLNTGFGINSSMYGGRLVNRDGSPNIGKKGIPILERFSWFHTMLLLPGWKFFAVLLITYLFINLIFATVYYLIGTEHLIGVIAQTESQKFLETFFFSTQTFTTVGYGRVSPLGFWASTTATFEAFLGLMNFAIATGLFYGRFSRPQAFLRYSDKALIAPYKEGLAFMFRMVPYKNNQLTDVEVRLNMAMVVEENGKSYNRFFSLDLELSKVNALNLSWTIVHPIDEKSPFYQLSQQDLTELKAEILVYVKAFDDTFSNTVTSRTSYVAHEIFFGGKFRPMYHRSHNGQKTIIELDKLHDFDKVDVSSLYPDLVNVEVPK